jgi:coenzyme F420-reducing hydrogenase gamma subunit
MAPRVVVLSLASDFGCQVQMTNIEEHLLDVLGRIDLSYWQLASSGHMPSEYDVAIVEGAVTNSGHVELLERVRETAGVVILVGACAITGGIPALAAAGHADRTGVVYGDAELRFNRDARPPRSVRDVIAVDYLVPGCPIDTGEYVAVLQRALTGLRDRTPIEPMCAACKIEENVCFYEKGELCMGVVTRTGCGANCISLGRPCTGCRGLAPDANFVSAARVLERHGFSLEDLLAEGRIYNATEEAPA